MENFDYFDALKESLEQAVDYTKGDKSRCRTVVRETPIPAYKAGCGPDTQGTKTFPERTCNGAWCFSENS